MPFTMQFTMQPFAFFDVDGTIIAKDSFFRLLRWRLGCEPWRIFPLLLLSPIFVLTYIFNWDRRYAKSALLWSLTCFKNRRKIVKILSCDLSEILFQEWLVETNDELKKLRNSNHKICYVSASGQIWLRGLLRRADTGPKIIIGSKLGFRFFGVVLISPNCYGPEKLVRIKQLLGNNLDWHCAYSDHIADIPLLAACKQRTLVNPRHKHLPIFDKNLPQPFQQVEWHTRSQKESLK